MAVETVGVSRSAVTGAIRTAARATGASFDYLLATAKVESDLNPNLTMRSSTATGLFQFLEQTWLGTLKQAGPALGYGNYANAITKTSSGRYEVADPALRREIMELRKDPNANALLGGAFTQQNAAVLAQRIGHKPSEGELYIGHFFGPYAGARAINLAASNPTARAADIFPAAARANGPIFYDKQGNARSVAGVCAELVRRYQVARASLPPDTQIAAAAPGYQLAAAPPRPPAAIPNVAPATTMLNDLMFRPAPIPTAMAFASEPSAVTNTRSAAVSPSGRVETAAPTFRSLFQTIERREPVAPVVTELWGAARAGQSSGADDGRGTTGLGSTLDLFKDLPLNPRTPADGST